MLIRAHLSVQLPPVGPIPLAGELCKLPFNANRRNGLWCSINSLRQALTQPPGPLAHNVQTLTARWQLKSERFACYRRTEYKISRMLLYAGHGPPVARSPCT
jgi:hypothetical protein